MAEDLLQRIVANTKALNSLYHRLILVVGPPRTGKSTTLRALAEGRSWPLINVNLALSERLLELTSRQRALKVPELLDSILTECPGEAIILDNLEILFSRKLRQDPLRLLQKLARHRILVAAWSGVWEADRLSYAERPHPECRQYLRPDALIVSVQDTHEEEAEA